MEALQRAESILNEAERELDANIAKRERLMNEQIEVRDGMWEFTLGESWNRGPNYKVNTTLELVPANGEVIVEDEFIQPDLEHHNEGGRHWSVFYPERNAQYIRTLEGRHESTKKRIAALRHIVSERYSKLSHPDSW